MRQVPDSSFEGVPDAVRIATERAERAQAELARVKEEEGLNTEPNSTRAEGGSSGETVPQGESALRNDSMMAHLLDSLEQGRDIGHYGRLVFAMAARHFMSHQELLGWLTRDPDFDELKAQTLIRQVEEHGYNPPKRERILEWQREQEFPILPNPQDTDCGNLYRNLRFPDGVYEHIEQYQEQKESSSSVE